MIPWGQTHGQTHARTNGPILPQHSGISSHSMGAHIDQRNDSNDGKCKESSCDEGQKDN